jgi:hypothetical protein
MQRDLDSHIEFASTFDERLEENKFFDNLNLYKKNHQHNFSSQIHSFPKEEYHKYLELQRNKNHFAFPERKLKSFVELDREYYIQTQIPEKRFEKLAETKYNKMYTMFQFPYNSSKQQNEEYITEKNTKIQFYTADKPAGPQNENWVTNDSQERAMVGANKVDDSYRFQIDSSLIDSNVKNTKIVFKNYA